MKNYCKLLKSSLLFLVAKRNPLVFIYAVYLSRKRKNASVDNEKQINKRYQRKCQYAKKHSTYYHDYKGEITTKALLVKNFNSIVRKTRFSVAGYTSGTTNSPMKVIRSWWSLIFEEAFILSYWWSFGFKNGDHIFIFRGQEIVSQYKKHFIKQPLLNNTIGSSYHISEANLAEYINEMETGKPVFIQAYPSAITALARLLKQQNWKPTWNVKGIITSSEAWSGFDAELVKEVFCTSIYDVYGHAERQLRAEQCQYGHYHFNSLYGKSEFVPTENGLEVVATSFYNYTMPLLRYATGDYIDGEINHLGNCKCGSAWPYAQGIKGRSDDYVTLPDGTLVSRLGLAFMKTPEVIEAQIVQDEISSVKITIVIAGSANKEATLAVLMQELKYRLGDEIQILLEVTDLIPRGKNGKFKSVISKL